MTRWRCLLTGDGETPETAFGPHIPDGIDWACVSVDHDAGLVVILTDEDLTGWHGASPDLDVP